MQGLYATLNLKKKGSRDDGAGGVTSALTSVASSVPCRRTRVTGEIDSISKGGSTGRQLWRFSTAPIAGVQHPTNSEITLYVIEYEGDLYDVVWFEKRPDHLGVIDHFEFGAELR